MCTHVFVLMYKINLPVMTQRRNQMINQLIVSLICLKLLNPLLTIWLNLLKIVSNTVLFSLSHTQVLMWYPDDWTQSGRSFEVTWLSNNLCFIPSKWTCSILGAGFATGFRKWSVGVKWVQSLYSKVKRNKDLDLKKYGVIHDLIGL